MDERISDKVSAPSSNESFLQPVNTYLAELSAQLSHLFAFCRQINELDFAASLGGEFRGAQDAGWSTTITAQQVYEEAVALISNRSDWSVADFRVALMLYCQLAEAGGFHETLKNIIEIARLKPYVLWPFQTLVRVKTTPRRIIGPNANAAFRAMATSARDIGMPKLSNLLELAYRDDIRNGFVHADYVIWNDGLRVRKRNGGHAMKLTFEEVNQAYAQGLGFFQLLRAYSSAAMRSFDPPRTIVGRFSSNLPMAWNVSCDPTTGAFSLSSDSVGHTSTPEYERQIEINGRLGGKVLACFGTQPIEIGLLRHIEVAGFEPNEIVMSADAWEVLLADVERLDLWDRRSGRAEAGYTSLMASPWGFRALVAANDFDSILLPPAIVCAVE